MEKQCRWCGKFFDHPRVVYCGEECRQEARYVSKRQTRGKEKKRYHHPAAPSNEDAIKRTVREIMAYNQAHGTHLTYGQYQLKKQLGTL